MELEERMKDIAVINFASLGYENWATELHGIGETIKFQKRMDTVEKYKDFPLCNTNDKININVEVAKLLVNDVVHVSYKFDIIQEANGIWSTLGFYGLSREDVAKYGVDELEDRLMELWKHFYFLQYQI